MTKILAYLLMTKYWFETKLVIDLWLSSPFAIRQKNFDFAHDENEKMARNFFVTLAFVDALAIFAI
jgi:hypothetical protein